VAETFFTEAPDLEGLLEVAELLATEAVLVPESLVVSKTSGGVSGKLQFGGACTGAFTASATGEYAIDVLGVDEVDGYKRQMTIRFTEENGMARNARIAIQSYPTKEAHTEDFASRQLTGWRVELDPFEGSRIYRTSTSVTASDDGSTYLFETNDGAEQMATEMPSLSGDTSFSRWASRLRTFKTD
jgi:hypothetical protein